MTHLATVEKYLVSLPGGVDAYPECAHRGEALSLWLQRSPTAGLAERLPTPVGALLGRVDGLPTWVPEVHATALYLAIREAHFPDDDGFLAHASECNRALLETPVNRLLFWVATPKALSRAAGLRWSSLHRGSSPRARNPSDHSVEVDLTFPAYLFPEIILRGTATGFAAALENAGARDVEVDVRLVEPTRARIKGRWR